MTGPRLAGETGGGLGLRPKSSTWKVLASTTRDRYRPVGGAAPGGPVAALSVNFPRMVTRNARTRSAPGTKSPGVAEVSAFARVVSTAVTQAGVGSPLAVAARLAIAVSREIADAGTGDRVETGDAVGAAIRSQPLILNSLRPLARTLWLGPRPARA